MIGLPHVHHRSTDSTNERAKALANEGAQHGTLVTADEQTAGRGRQGRTWSAAPGEALLMSVILRNLEPRHALLPLMAALAVCETVEQVAAETAPTDVLATPPPRCLIKWPNDVWLERRKLSGILVEARPAAGWAILGIGINTGVREFPSELRETATTLRLASPGEALAPLVSRIERWIAADKPTVLAAWRERDALLGSPVRWGTSAGADGASEGIARGVDDEGALLVETGSGELLALDAGEVHLAK
jgi:BirA family biotin operon repressor/biotin-[acetyl-CoA-carboxylase] ligase